MAEKEYRRKDQKTEYVGINYKAEQKRKWNAAARSESKRLVTWINDTLDDEANRTNSAINNANKTEYINK